MDSTLKKIVAGLGVASVIAVSSLPAMAASAAAPNVKSQTIRTDIQKSTPAQKKDATKPPCGKPCGELDVKPGSKNTATKR